MKLESLPKSKETKAKKIVGRGPGSGMGKTSTRGENGQKSRSGASINAWFQGGQSPLYRRLPKRGFNNARFAIKYATINLDDLEKFFNVSAKKFNNSGELLNTVYCPVIAILFPIFNLDANEEVLS